MKSWEIRKRFLSYFESKDHKVIPSSSLVPDNDPTLLFVNAGMVQFKGVFLGLETRTYKRAATCQKCVRAGGKHNDLENVGKTFRHHTFFEMLGNFSFGDYFKKEAIAYAWDFIINQLSLDRKRIWITVFKEDQDAYEIWKGMGVPEERILKLGEKDNFWAMGDEGPCGPCSEIHYDMGEEIGCGRPDCGVECDCDRFLEVWNLVFMEYERKRSGELVRLPRPSIDTGMGLERISAVMQEKTSNYDTDLFLPIIRKIEEISNLRYGEDDKNDIAMRVIADHVRSATFIIGDGVLPARDGRGYVLRRIIRRAMRFGRKLGIEEEFLYRLSSTVVDLMGDFYPEIRSNHAMIATVIKSEEEKFKETLSTGTNLYEEIKEELLRKGQSLIPGEVVYRLYDTYGFPLDLTYEMASEDGLQIDLEGFERALGEQKERSREATKTKIQKDLPTLFAQRVEEIKTEFLGYDFYELDGEVLKILKEDRETEFLSEGEEGFLIVDRTPFYPEGGGQVHDVGEVISKEARAEVTSVLRSKSDTIVHKVKVTRGIIRVREKVRLKIDIQKRVATSRNHTATHLLHFALRETLGEHVRQFGSLVESERLRFDFTHFMPLDEDQILKIQEIVNSKIMGCFDVRVEIKSKDEAIREGSIALFEEKYGEYVRVVKIGDFSKELCGGTHVRNTGEIGPFLITAESAISSGVRRIEAVTGFSALRYINRLKTSLRSVSSILSTDPERLTERVLAIVNEIESKEKQIQILRDQVLLAKAEQSVKDSIEINGVRIVSLFVEDLTLEELRRLSDFIRDKAKNSIAILGTEREKKGTMLVAVSKGLESRFSAKEIVARISEKYGGRGGGSQLMAQAGFPVENLKRALADVPSIINGF